MRVTEFASEECTLKIDQRGRGKFKPKSDYDINQVKKVLQKKINEELESISCSEMDNDYLKDIQYDPNKINVLSLFSGCGGLDLGFELSGVNVIHGEELTKQSFSDKKSYDAIRADGIFHTIYTNDLFKEANETYSLNFPKTYYQHEKDIRKVLNFPKADLILGGFPCPGFSEAGPRLIDDDRNFLYIHFIRAIMQARPAIFVAENVKGLLSIGKGEVIKQIVEDFSAAGYRVKYKLLNSRDYGVPQLRERVFIVGVREDLDFDYVYPKATHGENLKPFKTLKDAIGDLMNDPGPYYKGSYSSMYMSRNRKKKWTEQSFTIQASGRQAPLHPEGLPMEKIDSNKWVFPDGEENHRRLSVKEIARIQTFPDWFTFSDGNNMKASENNRLDKQYKQIGNAVPVFLAKAVADPIAKYFFSILTSKSHLRNKQDKRLQQLSLF